MLSTDLDIGNHLRGTIEDLIRSGGGSVTNSVETANIFICQFREGDEYKIASQEGKVVGNMSWLYHLFLHNTWTSPLRRLLHYPIARGGLPGFKKYRISLSNYNGDARLYLENLAKAAGCEFTKTMKQDNTHLITAHMISEKCEAAKEWNINMINHLWLEESYAKWQVQSLTNSRYIHFPPRTNLSEVVGQTSLDRQALERNFYPKDTIVGKLLNDRGTHKAIKPPDQTNTKTKVSNSSAPQALSPTTIKAPVGRPRKSEGTTPKLTTDRHKLATDVAVRTPAASRLTFDGKEDQTPSTTGSRGAKDRAAAKIHELAPDIALYEKEKKRVGGVVFGGRRKSDDKVEVNHKRSVSEDHESEADADDEARPAKRSKKIKGSPTMRVLVTGYAKWADNRRKESDDKVGTNHTEAHIRSNVYRVDFEILASWLLLTSYTVRILRHRRFFGPKSSYALSHTLPWSCPPNF